MEWFLNGFPVKDSDLEGFVGFVYLIENLTNSRKYIGKKLLTKSKTYQVKKKKKRKRVESDWRDYYGSSEELLGDVETMGRENFRRTIIHLCKSKGEMTYLEAKEQFARDVLLSMDYYNSWISCRIRRPHVRGLTVSSSESR
jgi:hypothetical protein